MENKFKNGDIITDEFDTGIVKEYNKDTITFWIKISWNVDNPTIELNSIEENIEHFIKATPREEIETLNFLYKEGYIWDGWQVIKDDSAEVKKDETIDESPAEEEIILSRHNKKKCIIDEAIENKIAHNINVSKDILDNTLPYYVINDKMEYLVRTTAKSLKRDLNNFNYFTNKEDINEAIRRVKETLMNFQEEIQNRNK